MPHVVYQIMLIMRINQYLAQGLGVSRRKANELVELGLVKINADVARHNSTVSIKDTVEYNGQKVQRKDYSYMLMNKPRGFVTSRAKQGTLPTIYSLLPVKHHDLKPVGRLDKNSCGLLLLTNDGILTQNLTHPSRQKQKRYTVTLDKELSKDDQTKINSGVKLKEGISSMQITGRGKNWKVTMSQGKNRQIRRTFAALGYKVTFLQRTEFGPYDLNMLESKLFKKVTPSRFL